MSADPSGPDGAGPAARRARPNLYTIPAGEPFLETLADAILHDRLDLGLDAGKPAALGGLTIFLPTRRAARALAAVLLKASGARALILPRLVPLGDPGEAELHDVLGQPDAGADAAGAIAGDTLPIAPLARQMLLAMLIRQASGARDRRLAASGAPDTLPGASLAASTLGSAFALAADLAALLDAMQADDVPFERLKTLDATRFDEMWQLTARFLAILGEAWPAMLAERGEVDPITWRNRLLAADAARLEQPAAYGRAQGRAQGPVIVAGSTGSMPATARLIATVARLRRGAVVLPDLDLDCDEASWAALGASEPDRRDRAASHPQAQLARLMETMQATRADVAPLGGAGPDVAPLGGAGANPRRWRGKLAHEALRPADTTEAWHSLGERMPDAEVEAALADIRLIEAPDERLEGLAVALAIKQALAEPDHVIALVTPDRGLAERVALELERWGIRVDDSAGMPLGRTQAGHLLLCLLAVMQRGGDSDSLLCLMHHGMVRLGLEASAAASARHVLEIGALRGARPFAGLAGLGRAVDAMPARIADIRAPRPRKRLTPDDVATARALAGRLMTALEPLLAPADSVQDLAAAIARLRAALEALTLTGEEPEEDALAFSGEDGDALAALLDDLEAALAGQSGDADDLAAICRNAMAGRVVRIKGREHPRLMLLGQIEARLMSADLVILGGLVEGSWPPQTSTDPFLNRAMRAELGLSSPERRIGQSAHDFIQALGAPRVILSRPLKVAGVPTLPSRFWQRLRAVSPPKAWAGALERGRIFADFAGCIDRAATVKAAVRPKPLPPLHLQPVRYSVTEVETLYRDPYALFARRILGLDALEPLEVAVGAADRGSLLHQVMEAFALAWPAALPPDVPGELRRIGRSVFSALADEPDVQGFWWPRFVQLVPDIAAWEAHRRMLAASVGTELRIKGMVRLADGAEIMLTARADRIEQLRDGTLAVLDFKSGTVPSPKQIEVGLAPQLPLEAALARIAPFAPAEGDGPSFGPGNISSALHVALKPGKVGLDERAVSSAEELARLADEHMAGFKAMLAGFRDGSRPFTSRFAPQFMRHDSDYDHLARVKEWSAAGQDDGEDAA